MFTLFGINGFAWAAIIITAAVLTVMAAVGVKRQPQRAPVRTLSREEQELEMLEIQYESGKISSEQYRARRAAILSSR